MSEASEATQFKFGNDAWKARSSHGRKPIFETPDDLEKACYEYLQWVSDNPLVTVDVAKFQGTGALVPVPKMRAMTEIGLCNFLDIGDRTWRDYKKKPEFSPVCEMFERMIYQQKLEGAAADMLNGSIIARELGLADKKDVALSGELKAVSDDMDLETAARVLQDNLKSLGD